MIDRTRIMNLCLITPLESRLAFFSLPFTNSSNVNSGRANRQRGFSLIELAIVMLMLMIVAAMAIPQVIATRRAYRVMSDAKSLASQLALAKMRAADGFTQARLNCNLTARSCQFEICTSKGVSGCNTFSAEGGTVTLSEDVSFGFGSITTPAGTQTTIQNSALIQFNSRSLPIDSTGAPTGDYALYLTNTSGYTFAVTVYVSGRIAVWQYDGSTWKSQ